VTDRVVAVSYAVDDDFTRANTDVLAGEAEVIFLQALSDDERAAAIGRAEAIIGWNPGRELSAESLANAPGLRLIQLLSAGADSVDFAAIPAGVIVAGNVGAYAKPMAEHVLALTLALARRLPERHAQLAAGTFNQREPLITLDGAVVAILGYGGIGRATARLMRSFGARIFAVNSSGRTEEPVDFAGTLADLDEVLTSADVLVISLPLSNSTRGLIGARELALMKPAAILVNVARGAIIDERALYEHLAANPGFHAGIDAWWQEPRGGSGFCVGFPFFELPNLLGSPHNSAIVPGAVLGAAGKAAENVRRYLRGERVTGVMRREDYISAPDGG
jgi:phosphoglycerate dehydrogenase-like enzyme